VSLLNNKSIVDSIYLTGYFTNHGPTANDLERALADFFDIENSVIVSNESLALVIALAGLQLRCRIVVPAYCPGFVYNSVIWSGLDPVVLDVELDSHNISMEKLKSNCRGDDSIGAILICDFWGGGNVCSLIEFALSLNLKVIVYQCGYFAHVRSCGMRYPIDNVVTVLTVGFDSYLPTTSCASILTSDNDLAERYRNIRSSYGAMDVVKVKTTANGRVSEFQAGEAKLFLDNFEEIKKHNYFLYSEYRSVIDKYDNALTVRYMDVVEPDYGSFPVIALSDESELTQLTKSMEKIKGIVSCSASAMFVSSNSLCFENAVYLNQRTFILPVGLDVSIETAKEISCKVGVAFSRI
jgi:dTDP-4-amino-4,6-dideoxygalactose transaminase